MTLNSGSRTLHRLDAIIRMRGGLVTDVDLDAGFEFGGGRIRFWNLQMGIWRAVLLRGLQKLHGDSLVLPKEPRFQPNRDYSAERFERFWAA